MLISSQKYLNDDIVEEKRLARDYAVTISPEFEIDGVVMQVITDGHHSMAAALADGVEPEFSVCTVSEDDRMALIETSIDDFLIACWIDSDYYDFATGHPVF